MTQVISQRFSTLKTTALIALLGSIALIATLIGASILVLGTVLGIVLGTESGRHWGINKAVDIARTPELSITLTQLKTPNLGVISFDTLKIQRSHKPWITIEGGYLAWRPAKLLKKTLSVVALTAHTVDYYASASVPDKKDSKAFDPQLVSSWPIKLDSLKVNSFTAHNLLSGNKPPAPPRTTNAAAAATTNIPSLSVQGSATLFHQQTPFSLNLLVRSLPQAGFPNKESRLNITSQNNNTGFGLQGRLTEPAGGFIGSKLLLPTEQSVNAEFDLLLTYLNRQWDIRVNTLSLPYQNALLQLKSQITLDIQRPSVEVRDAVLTIDKSRQAFSGQWLNRQLSFDLDFKELPIGLAQPWLQQDIQGKADIRAQGRWAYETERLPTATFEIHSQGQFGNSPLDLHLKGDASDELIVLETADLAMEQTTAELKGTVDAFGPLNNFDFKIANFDSDLLKTSGIAELSSQVSHSLTKMRLQLPLAKGHVSNSFRDPNLKVKTSAALTYLNKPFNIELDTSATKTHADIEHLKVTSGQHSVVSSGRLNWADKTAKLQTSFNNINNDLLAYLPKNISDQVPPGLSFNGNGALSLEGSASKPKLTADFSITGLYNLDEALGTQKVLPYKLQFKGTGTGSSLSDSDLDMQNIQLSLFNKPVLSLSGEFNRANANLKLKLDRLPSETLQLLGWKPLPGEAEGLFNLTGTSTNPSLHGEVIYTAQTKNSNKNRAANMSVTTQVSTHDKVLTLNLNASKNAVDIGRFKLSVPITPYLEKKFDFKGAGGAIPIELSALGNIDLAPALEFINQDIHRITGTVDADFNIAGTLKSPKILGFVKSEKIRYHNAVLGVAYENIEFNVLGKQDRLSIEKFNAIDADGGKLSLSGHVNLLPRYRNSEKFIQANLVADNAAISKAKLIEGKVHGELTLFGNLDELWIKGDAELRPLNISIASASKTTIPTIKYSERKTNNAQAEANNFITHLDIKLVAQQQAYIRGRGLETELAGGIRLTGTATNLDYRGEFKTIRGRIEAFGKRFSLNRGLIQLSNETLSLNIVAVHSTDQYEFTIALSGTQEQPKITLSSVPALPDDEILARLIFGKSVLDISPFQAIQLAAAAQTLAKGSSFDPIESTRSALGVDSLTIDNEQVENGDSKLSLGVGKYINERVYVELKHTSNATQPWQGKIEVELTPRITLQSASTDTGGSKTGIVWKKDY